MTTVAFTVNSSTYDSEDRRTAKAYVQQENARITNANAQLIYVNQQRANNVPPLAPIADAPLWDVTSPVTVKNAYEALIAKELVTSHTSRVAQVTEQQVNEATTKLSSLKSAWADATEAKRQAAQAAALAALA